MATGIGAYVIETDGSVHEMVSAGDGNWEDEEIGNILTYIFSSKELPLLEEKINDSVIRSPNEST